MCRWVSEGGAPECARTYAHAHLRTPAHTHTHTLHQLKAQGLLDMINATVPGSDCCHVTPLMKSFGKDSDYDYDDATDDDGDPIPATQQREACAR